MGMWSRIRKTFRGDRHTAEIQEELQFHLQMDAAQGHGAREARMRLGHVARIEEETRAMGIVEWLDSAIQTPATACANCARRPRWWPR